MYRGAGEPADQTPCSGRVARGLSAQLGGRERRRRQNCVAKIDDSSGSRSYNGLAVSGSIEVTPGPGTKSLGGVCNVPGSRFCGHPINIGTGNMFEQVTDYSTTAPNRLSFTRYYNSLGPPNVFAATLGRNWRSTYDRYLYIISPSSVAAERADGQILNFVFVNGAWTTDSDVDL
jgi:hypothetical protein